MRERERREYKASEPSRRCSYTHTHTQRRGTGARKREPRAVRLPSRAAREALARTCECVSAPPASSRFFYCRRATSSRLTRSRFRAIVSRRRGPRVTHVSSSSCRRLLVGSLYTGAHRAAVNRRCDDIPLSDDWREWILRKFKSPVSTYCGRRSSRHDQLRQFGMDGKSVSSVSRETSRLRRGIPGRV